MRRTLSPAAQAAGLRIEKVIAGYAYARNGSAPNTTARVLYVLKDAAGQVLDNSHRHSDLLESADLFLADGCL